MTPQPPKRPPPPSAPGKVRSAARSQPLPEEPRTTLSKERLREGALDVLLNAVSILKELVEDFKSSNRFFKYKAGIVGGWLLLTVTSVGVACPGAGGGNDLGASLVIAGDANAPVFMVRNGTDVAWRDVVITVNGVYRSTTTVLAPHDGLTLSPVVLFDAHGTPAPRDLRITDIVVKAGVPDEGATLLERGRPRY